MDPANSHLGYSGTAASYFSDFDPTLDDRLIKDLWTRLLSAINKQRNESMTGKLNHQSVAERVPYPDILSGNMSKGRLYGQRMRRLVKWVARAFLNPVHVPWDVEDFYYSHLKGGADKERIQFPNPSFGAHSEPLTVVDSKGRIVLWYLPGLIGLDLQFELREATLSLNRLLRTSVKQRKGEKAVNWRVNDSNFIPKVPGQELEPGSITLSGGWFAQGHETEKYDLLPSANLRNQSHLGSSEWLKLSNEVERFLNLTVSLINPNLFESGLQMLRQLRKLEKTKETAEQWQSIYTGISIISNRLTPAHRDSKGRPEWFDTLISYSDPSAKPTLLLPDLGLQLDYPSGTVIAFCGAIFQHQVKSWGEGDRICYAHFMREAVRNRLDVSPAGWVDQAMNFKIQTKLWM